MGLNEAMPVQLEKGCQGLTENRRSLGLYLHVPFCSRPCDYCAFYQVQSDRQGILDYIEGVSREIEILNCDQGIDTCFWGGGTPSLLPAGDLEKLCRLIVDGFGRPRLEWTVEMAPSSVKADKLQILKDCGVNRVSLGIQSLDEGMLDSLGRPHSPKQVLSAYDLIKSFEFDSVNIDLMFAIPGQTPEQLSEDLRNAVALEPDHISTYCLTFEEDTALYVKLSQGKVSIDQELEEQLYRLIWEKLGEAGYEQYEISNYAKPGKQCLHNLNTWRMNEWMGVGPSAASQYKGVRSSNPSDLDKWRDNIDKGLRGTEDRVFLSDDLLLEDSVIFGLRMNEGVDCQLLAQRFDSSKIGQFQERLDTLVADGLGDRSGQHYTLSDKGRLVADAVGAELVGIL